MGVTAQISLVQTYLFCDFVHSLLDLTFRHSAVVTQGLTDYIENRHSRIQAGIGILKDHLDIPAVFLHLRLRSLQEIDNAVFFRMEQDLTAGCVNAADYAAAKRGLTAAGFADDADRLSLIDRQGDVRQRLDAGALGVIDLGEIFDFQNCLFIHFLRLPAPAIRTGHSARVPPGIRIPAGNRRRHGCSFCSGHGSRSRAACRQAEVPRRR